MSGEVNAKQVFEKLDGMDTKIDSLLLWKGVHTEAHKRIEEIVGDNHSVLFDNPGLVQKVAALWSCKKSLTKVQEFWMCVFRYLIIAVIIGVVGWLLLLYKGVPV